MYFLSYFVWTLTEENSEKAPPRFLNIAKCPFPQWPTSAAPWLQPTTLNPLLLIPSSASPPDFKQKNIDVDLSRKWSRRFNKQHVQHGTHTLVGNVKSTCHTRWV